VIAALSVALVGIGLGAFLIVVNHAPPWSPCAAVTVGDVVHAYDAKRIPPFTVTPAKSTASDCIYQVSGSGAQVEISVVDCSTHPTFLNNSGGYAVAEVRQPNECLEISASAVIGDDTTVEQALQSDAEARMTGH
jgi:hypothetical protein